VYRVWLLILITFSAHATDITPHLDNKSSSQQCRLAIGCIFQQEGPWLKEWIEFHRLIGVEHFYLYNNLSTDNYLEILAPYVQSGIVELFDYPVEFFERKDQVAVYMHAFAQANANQTTWLALIDADEYIVPMESTSILDLLEEHSEHGAIYLWWQVFGTSGVEKLEEDELMLEKLTLKVPEDDIANIWGKTIVQTRFGERASSAHFFRCAIEKQYKIVPLQKARVNHYLVRTEEYLRKVKLPRLQKWQDMGRENMFNPVTLKAFLANSEYHKDDSVMRFIAPLKERMKVFK
jgi:hypothetical protein